MNAIDKGDFSSFAFLKDDETIQVDKNRLKEIATEIFDVSNRKA